VGYHAHSIKVNNRIVPMGYRLKSGDQVEVITSRNQKPSESWLNMVITGKARSKIRAAMKEERKKLGESGKEKLLRKFRKLKLDFEQNVDLLVKHLKLGSRADLFYLLAQEKIDLNDVLKDFEIEHGSLKYREPTSPTAEKQHTQRVTLSSNGEALMPQTLYIDGEPASKYKYTLASCCHPVPGDNVFAYVTKNKEFKIHRYTCPNATNMLAKFGYRALKAEWHVVLDREFVVDLQLNGIDDGPGVIQRITNTISNELGLNIRSLNIEGREGYFTGKLSVVVKNRDQLEVVMRKLSQVKGVTNVSRI